MISRNLKSLRKKYQYTQDDIAEKLNVSRQSVAKWESGESTPDIYNCIKIAKLFNVKLDDLVNHSEEESGLVIPPKGKYFFGSVLVGERGQIVIPKEARDMFDIKSGDSIIVLCDKKQGIALIKSDIIEDLSDKVFQKGDK